MVGESRLSIPDFVIIGHLARDIVPNGYRLGGTAAFAAITARNLGARVGIVTSYGSDLELGGALDGIDVLVVAADQTTTFENVYGPEGRRQWVRALAAPLNKADIPQTWLAAPITLLGPLVGEVDYNLGGELQSELVAATAQGWLREWDDSGLVIQRPWMIGAGDRSPAPIVIVSIDDVGFDERVVDRLSEVSDILVVTRGAEGATLHVGSERMHFPAFRVIERDPTGAGDVFAAAFLWHYAQTQSATDAMMYANCAASFAVESEGTAGCPTADQVTRRLRDGIRG
jgi:1D-myo-inositol 3-kinase